MLFNATKCNIMSVSQSRTPLQEFCQINNIILNCVDTWAYSYLTTWGGHITSWLGWKKTTCGWAFWEGTWRVAHNSWSAHGICHPGVLTTRVQLSGTLTWLRTREYLRLYSVELQGWSRATIPQDPALMPSLRNLHWMLLRSADNNGKWLWCTRSCMGLWH